MRIEKSSLLRVAPRRGCAAEFSNHGRLILPKAPKTEPQTLLKADDITLVARAERDGHLRLTCKAWEDARVILPGQVLELRWENGQVVAVRRDKRK